MGVLGGFMYEGLCECVQGCGCVDMSCVCVCVCVAVGRHRWIH